MKLRLVENADDPYDGLPPDVFETIVTALVNGLLAQDAAVAAALQPCDTVELHGEAATSANTREDEGHDVDQHRRLMRIALDEHTVLTELVREAVREWLDRRTRRRSSLKSKERKRASK